MNRLADHEHPLTTFMRLHELDKSTSFASMSAALELMQRDSKMSKADMAQKLLAGYTGGGSSPVGYQYMYEFGYQKVEGHQEAAQEAERRLSDLRRVVDDVEREGWPRKSTRPVLPA
jgi:hypothetical protein